MDQGRKKMRITKSTRLGFLQQMILCARKCIEILNNLFHSHFAPFEFWWIEFRKECLCVMNRRKKNEIVGIEIEFWRLNFDENGKCEWKELPPVLQPPAPEGVLFSSLVFFSFKSLFWFWSLLFFQIKVSQINNCLLHSIFSFWKSYFLLFFILIKNKSYAENHR